MLQLADVMAVVCLRRCCVPVFRVTCRKAESMAANRKRADQGVSPYNLEAEQATLASVLLDNSVWESVRQLVRADDFFGGGHHAIFAVIDSLRVSGSVADAVTIAEQLGRDGRLGEVGGMEYLYKLLETVPNAAHAVYYARIVTEYAARRRGIVAADAIKQRLLAGDEFDDNSADIDTLDALRRERSVRTGSELVTVRASDIEPLPLEWLWTGRIPLGALTLFSGDAGLGKSFVTLDISARVSRGMEWPDGSASSQPVGSVIIANCEDDLARTVVPRLDRAGADRSQIVFVDGVNDPGHRSNGAAKGRKRFFTLDRDLPLLERTLSQIPDCRLVIVDPISAFCGGIDTHKNADVRSLLTPLTELASRFGVAVIAVTHLKKGNGGRAVHRSVDSIAFMAAARAGWMFAKDSDDQSRRLMLPAKMNLAPDSSGLAYRIESPSEDIPGVVVWEPEPVAMHADDALAAEQLPTASRRGQPRRRAAEFLRDFLSDGKRPADEVFAAAETHGITEKTLNRAAKELGIEKTKAGFDGGWLWSLSPSDGEASAEDDQNDNDLPNNAE